MGGKPGQAGAGGAPRVVDAAAESDSGDADASAQTYCGADGGLLMLPWDAVAGCTWVRGSLLLPDWGESSLPLQALEGVDENLRFFRPHNLTSMRGLERLRHVGGELGISHDDSGRLSSLDGLEALRECGSLHISSNSGLTHLRGLRGLEVVHGDVTITGNASLPQSEIDALLSHVEVRGVITIRDNKK